jgi:hypothetical protein
MSEAELQTIEEQLALVAPGVGRLEMDYNYNEDGGKATTRAFGNSRSNSMISTNHIRFTHRVYTYFVPRKAKPKPQSAMPKNVRPLHSYSKRSQTRSKR